MLYAFIIPFPKVPAMGPAQGLGMIQYLKYWAGQRCKKTGLYGQHSDVDSKYAGLMFDRFVEIGEKFPPSLNNHHFQFKT